MASRGKAKGFSMRKTYDLSRCEWTVAGYTPYEWHLRKSMETAAPPLAEIPPIPARVPGSVQAALREAGVIPDWNIGLDARLSEWVENRHWVFETALPDAWLKDGSRFRLNCLGLDYCGGVFVNGEQAGEFVGTHVPHVFDLSRLLKPSGNLLQIVFTDLPRWLGQFGYTSRYTEWKERFNYTWDWTSRVVQVGIWDSVVLEASDGREIRQMRCLADFSPASQSGYLKVWGEADADDRCEVEVSIRHDGRVVWTKPYPVAQFIRGIVWDALPVQPWWPNGEGDQPLYAVSCRLLDGGQELDCETRNVGFRHVEWRQCEGAPPGADPWICVVNGRPLFLQGVDWSPIRPNFADVTQQDYSTRVELYRDMGCNIFRVWGGAVLERDCFYDLCDELGLLVWQEFPLSSSGTDNWPPEDMKSIAEMSEIARSFIIRRQHHASLLLWCGGNELQGTIDGGKVGCGKPITKEHPMMRELDRIVAAEDPGRRFIETSSSGPRFTADEKDFGKGLHWDVHGPWSVHGSIEKDWPRYWQNEDSLFRSEVGTPGASPLDIIMKYRGGLPEVPGTIDNPLWRRQKWWIDWPAFVAEKSRQPQDIAEYVAWSQDRQKRALAIAAKIYKAKFPRCGGIIFWMGHDSFPCMTNTAIVDFHGRPKPAALALAEVFKAPKSE